MIPSLALKSYSNLNSFEVMNSVLIISPTCTPFIQSTNSDWTHHGQNAMWGTIWYYRKTHEDIKVMFSFSTADWMSVFPQNSYSET